MEPTADHEAPSEQPHAPPRLSRRTFLRLLAAGAALPALGSVLAACQQQPASSSVAPTPPADPIPSAAPAATAQPATPTAQPTATLTPVPPTPTPAAPVRFAVIGDYGLAGEAEQAVAELVKSWRPAFIVTTGDNNYPSGEPATLDQNVGQYYHLFMSPYQGRYGTGAETNRFFPVLGNHDWDQGVPSAYLDYFGLTKDQRYYTFAQTNMRFFALDSMPGEPDGVTADSRQAAWLKRELAAAKELWKIVVMHHPPFSSGHHGSNPWMRWPYQEWGADIVLAGHDHDYERIIHDGFPYLINGLGGGSRYAPGDTTVAGSALFYNKDHGAQLVEVTDQQMTFQFITRTGKIIDTYTLTK